MPLLFLLLTPLHFFLFYLKTLLLRHSFVTLRTTSEFAFFLCHSE